MLSPLPAAPHAAPHVPARRQPDEGDAALLQRALAHLTATTASGVPPPQAAALLQRLTSLVQAGLPMRTRGDFW